jgi:RecB family exonuclease
MTKKQQYQFNQMLDALREIANQFETPEQLRMSSEKKYGLDYEEAIEMSYENILNTARDAIKGIRSIKIEQ